MRVLSRLSRLFVTSHRAAATSPQCVCCHVETNEATAFCGFGINKTMLAADIGIESPTYINAPEQNATNERTGAREIVANEANAVSGFGMNEHTPSADVGLESPTYMNATSEPTLSTLDDGGVDADITAGMNDGDDGDFPVEIDREKVGERIRAGTAIIAARRAEFVRKLNEQTRRQAKEANVGRRSRPIRHKNGKPADRHTKRAAGAEPKTMGTNKTRTVGDPANQVNAGSGLTIRAGPANV
jgi:hypothetical protein